MSEDNKNSNAGWDFDEEKKAFQKKPAQYAKADYDIFIRLKPQEKPFKIRIASNPKNFRSHWAAFKSISKAPIRSPAYSVDERSLDIAWAEGDWLPQRRHACTVFDRDDGDKLKILEAGDSVFSHFGNWFKATGINPSSNEGTDWFIWVKDNGGTTEYSATPDIKTTPFTDDEKKIIANPPFDLNKVIKIKTPEEIKQMWLDLDDDKKYNPRSKYKVGATFNKSDFDKKYGKTEENKSITEKNVASNSVNGEENDASKEGEKIKEVQSKKEVDTDELPF